MKISVRVIPRSSKNEIAGLMADGTLKIKLKAAPVEGEANESLTNILSKHFGVAKSQINIKSGRSGRNKIIEIG